MKISPKNEVIQQITDVLGEQFHWPPQGKKLLPKGTTLEQACEVAELIGLPPIQVVEVNFSRE